MTKIVIDVAEKLSVIKDIKANKKDIEYAVQEMMAFIQNLKSFGGGSSLPKSDTKVHCPLAKSHSSSCKWNEIHELSSERKLSKPMPAVLSIANFPDSGDICVCQPRLYLRSSDFGDKDFSRPICELLGLESMTLLYIELDGFSRKGSLRLLSLMKSVLKQFDHRLTVIFLSEKCVALEAIQQYIEKEYDFDNFSNKKVCTFGRGNDRLSNKVEISDHEKDLEISALNNKICAFEKLVKENEDLNEVKVDLLNEKISKLLTSELTLMKENKALEIDLDEKSDVIKRLNKNTEGLEAVIEDLKVKNREKTILANEHLNERNEKLKQKEEGDQKLTSLTEVLNVKDRRLEKLENDCEEMKKQIKLSQNIEEKFNKEISRNEEFQTSVINLKSSLDLSKKDNVMKSTQLDTKQGRIFELESMVEVLKGANHQPSTNLLQDLDEDGRATIQIIKDDIKKIQASFPVAGSSEIIHRSIKSFMCNIRYDKLEMGWECTASVVTSSLVKLSCFSTFKAKGSSKQKAKQKAFDDLLSLILNCC